MSIDRCKEVHTIVDSFLTCENGSITNDKPEVDGVYSIAAIAPAIAHAARLVAAITLKLVRSGFSLRNIEIIQHDTNASMTFHVYVGDIRKLKL